jgi:membrane protein
VTDFVDETFADSAPLEAAVLDLFEADQRRVLTVTTFFALFTLSRGFAGIIRGLDDVYEVEERRRWWHVRLNAIVMGTGTIAVIATTSTFLALLPSRIGPLATVVFVPISLLVLVAWATTLFHWGPNHRTPWRYDLPGAVVTAIGWTVATQLFAVYVRVAGAGNQVQSTVGALLLGITLLYTLAVIMLVGAEVNDVLARRAGVVQAPIGFRERVESARGGFDSARSLVDDLRDRKSD